MLEIPEIDLSPLFSSSDSTEKTNLVHEIRRACENFGFFQVVGHGIDQQLMENIIVEARRFFDQSTQEKQRYAVKKWNRSSDNVYRGYFPASVNGKEGLDLSSPYLNREHELVRQHDPFHELNQWPINEVVTAYWDEMWRLSVTLVRALACSFDLDPSYFEKYLDDRSLGGAGTVSTLRFNFYPYLDNPPSKLVSTDDGQPLSCEEHCDGCLLTILYQYEVGGLQIQLENGSWIDVPVVPNGLVVNTGRCFERWTNGRLKAINHRVKLLKAERFSIPFFLEPSFSTPIVPVLIKDDTPRYLPTTYREYITESNKKFKEYQRDE